MRTNKCRERPSLNSPYLPKTGAPYKELFCPISPPQQLHQAGKTDSCHRPRQTLSLTILSPIGLSFLKTTGPPTSGLFLSPLLLVRRSIKTPISPLIWVLTSFCDAQVHANSYVVNLSAFSPVHLSVVNLVHRQHSQTPSATTDHKRVEENFLLPYANYMASAKSLDLLKFFFTG